jgi:hypothetical protein
LLLQERMVGHARVGAQPRVGWAAPPFQVRADPPAALQEDLAQGLRAHLRYVLTGVCVIPVAYTLVSSISMCK